MRKAIQLFLDFGILQAQIIFFRAVAGFNSITSNEEAAIKALLKIDGICKRFLDKYN